MSYVPSPLLQKAVREALHHVRRHRPDLLTWLPETSESALQMLTDFCYAAEGAELDAVREVGLRWVTQSKYAPEPSEFGEMAKAISRERLAPTVKPERVMGPVPLRPIVAQPHDVRINTLYQRAVNGGVRPSRVGEVFAMASAECESPEQLAKLRDGVISLDLWDTYISRVAHGQMAPDVARGSDSDRAKQRRPA